MGADDLKQAELSILREFIRVCDSLGLKYYLLGGSMLGAVRHRGFIPWDDDIDVGMPRRDYQRFLRQGKSLLPERLFLQNLYTDPEVLHNITKLRDSSTTFIETSVKDRRINHGVFIDIFPLDVYPDDPRSRSRIERGAKWASRRIYLAYTLPPELKPRGLKALGLRVLGCLAVLRFPRTIDALRRREALYSAEHSGSLIANYCGAWGKKEYVPASWYGEGVPARFEDLEARIPDRAELWLTQVYGDYMRLPPPEKRKAHHYAERIDTARPYTQFLSG